MGGKVNNDDDIVLPSGEIIDGKYEIIAKIGQGGMGVVYKAHSLSLNRDVAIKMLTHVDEATIQRFQREANSLAGIKHRAIISAHDFGDSGKWGPYLVLAYHRGRDLRAVANSSPSIQEAVDLTLAICTGISACHACSIIHRDLKPSNILVTNSTSWQDRVKILDFGLALPFDSPILKAYQTRITHVGMVPGTPRYIAPELLRRQQPTQQCDQYGIASLLYLLLTGRSPFDDLEGDELLHAIVHGNYTPLHVLRPDTSETLQTAVLRGLHLDPAQRFPNVDDFAIAIVDDASPNLRNSFTRYFLNAKRPINRRLIEPVSAYHPGGLPERRSGLPERGSANPMILAPMVDPARLSKRPNNIVPIAGDSQPRHPSPAAPLPSFSPSTHVPPIADAPASYPSVSAPSPHGASPSASPPVSANSFPSTAPSSKNNRLPSQPLSHKSIHRRRLETENNAIFLVLCGAALGSALTIGAFICFLMYQSHSSLCLPSPNHTPPHGEMPPGRHDNR
jgi:serine/threonine protein kinase